MEVVVDGKGGGGEELVTGGYFIYVVKNDERG